MDLYVKFRRLCIADRYKTAPLPATARRASRWTPSRAVVRGFEGSVGKRELGFVLATPPEIAQQEQTNWRDELSRVVAASGRLAVMFILRANSFVPAISQCRH